MKEIPPHIVQIYGSKRKFKQTKRAEWKEVIKAFNKFQMGCAFTPGFHSLTAGMANDIRTVKDGLSRANWGR